MANQEGKAKFKKGEVIKRPKPNSGGLVHHYGVSMGNGRVIHLTKTKGIQECSLGEFADGPEVKISKARVSSKPLPLEKTAGLAQYYNKNRDKWGEYNVITNNCEHFATNCATGKKCSGQVQTAWKTIAAGTAVVLGTVLIGPVVINAVKGNTSHEGGNPFGSKYNREPFVPPSAERKLRDNFPFSPEMPEQSKIPIPEIYPSFPSKEYVGIPQMGAETHNAFFPGMDVSNRIANEYMRSTISNEGMNRSDTSSSFKDKEHTYVPQSSAESYESMFPSLRDMNPSSSISSHSMWGSISHEDVMKSILGNSLSLKF